MPGLLHYIHWEKTIHFNHVTSQIPLKNADICPNHWQVWSAQPECIFLTPVSHYPYYISEQREKKEPTEFAAQKLYFETVKIAYLLILCINVLPFVQKNIHPFNVTLLAPIKHWLVSITTISRITFSIKNLIWSD